MVFPETPVFTRQIKALVDDGQYLELQALLMVRPDAGNLIRGSRGLRKIRMRLAGRGKRGGASVVYYWKNEQADLHKEEIRMLGELVREEFG